MTKQASLGFGLGLRTPHYHHVLGDEKVSVDWFELISENFIGLGAEPCGRPLDNLIKIREKFPLVLHGVSLSIGGTDALDLNYLNSLKQLYHIAEPSWVSDHLCWTGVHGKHLHDLLPLPYSEETLAHVVSRLQKVQDFLGRSLVIENVSSYLSYTFSEMSENEFLVELVRRSGAKLLLDVNNVYVSSVNHKFDALKFIGSLPKNSVQQIHLAGHTTSGPYLIDTHDEAVCDDVWALYEQTLKILGPDIPTMIERDGNIPDFKELEKELSHAKLIAERVKQAESENFANTPRPNL